MLSQWAGKVGGYASAELNLFDLFRHAIFFADSRDHRR